LIRATPAVLLLAALVVRPLAASGAPADPRATPLASPEPPAVVLARYVAALQSAALPKYVRFEYSVEQVGARDLVQTHRIYRSGQTERDEILSADGQLLPNPSVSIVRHRVDRYSISALAPRPANYVFAYLGKRRAGTRYDYSFATQARSPGAFDVTGVVIDGRRYLPSQVAFTADSGKVRASGRLSYAPFERYWLIVEASVTAHFDGKVSRERIAWGRYAFPASLPDSTFVAPRPLTTPSP
jgi:hypothetical protein